MHRAAALGYMTTDQLAAAAGLSNRTVWALVTGERASFSKATCARLETWLLVERGSIGAALDDDDPGEIRFVARAHTHRESRRREVASLLASAGIPQDPARLRSGASRLRAAAPPRDQELADIATIAELIAAYLDGEEYVQSTFSKRLAARSALTGRDRAAFSARAAQGDLGPARRRHDEAEEEDPAPGIPPTVFRAV